MPAVRISPKQKVDLFEQYRPLALKLAWKFAKKYKRQFDEMRDEADGILSELCADWNRIYNPELSEPITYIYNKINFGLLEYIERSSKEEALPFSVVARDPAESTVSEVPAPPSFLTRVWNTLSDDARTIVSTICFAPAEIEDMLRLPHRPRARRAVKRYLLDKMGWSVARVRDAWHEVEDSL